MYELAHPVQCFLQAEAFAGWLAWHQESRSKRLLLLSSVQLLQQGALGRAFRSWATHSAEYARLRSMAVSCLARMQLAVQHRAFTSWQQGAHGAAEARWEQDPNATHRNGYDARNYNVRTGLVEQVLTEQVGLPRRTCGCSSPPPSALTVKISSVLGWSWPARAGQCWRAAVRIGSGRRWR